MIYLDKAATSVISDKVIDFMTQIEKDVFGNPSSMHSAGRKASDLIREARERVANKLNCSPDNIFFTSGATESNNWILTHYGKPGTHIITSAIEHPSVLNTCKELEEQGVEITYLPVDEYGTVDEDELRSAIKENTVLVSIQYANNEVGTIQNIPWIAHICNECGIPFHTDAVQMFCKADCCVDFVNQMYKETELYTFYNSHVDFMSISAHKIGGPKGVGALYVREPDHFKPMIYGGGQEKGLRSGTENVAGIAGFGMAAELINENNYLTTHSARLYLLKRLREIDGIKINGNSHSRVPGIISATIEGVDGDSLVEMLDELGICISTGSACHSNSGEPSHVLKAMGMSDEEANSTIRISFDHNNDIEELIEFADKLTYCINILRGI